MRNARKLVLLALAAVAAMAFSASSASAQTIEVFNEDTGQHCPAIVQNGHSVSGGCAVGVSSTAPVELRRHIIGIESHVADCDNRYTAIFNEDGGAAVTNFQITNCVGDADVTACDEGDAHNAAPLNGNTPWRGTGSEGATANVVNASLTVCIETGVFGIRCEGPASFPINTAAEQYTISLNDTRLGSSVCEVDGNYAFDPSSIHVNHL